MKRHLDSINFNEKNAKGDPVYSLATIASTIKQIPSLVIDLNKAEKVLNAEIEEMSKMRGAGIKKIFEDGLETV